MTQLKTVYFLNIVVIVLFFTATFTVYTNFHEVTPGVLYRSKQLSGSQFDQIIKKYQFKTVINLRGASPNERWYKDELNVMRKNSVTHIDIGLSATRYVSPQKIDSIMGVAASATKPILVHCKRGADRTGLFCAAWKLKCQNTSIEKASKQLSIVYGHIYFPLLSKTCLMDSSFNDYARIIAQDRTHGN